MCYYVIFLGYFTVLFSLVLLQRDTTREPVAFMYEKKKKLRNNYGNLT